MPLFDKLTVSSPDITNLERIPDGFTANGGHVEPRLTFAGAPEGTVELAVVCHDPDAPLPHGFTHWTIYGIPGDAVALDFDVDAVRVGPNTLGETDWTGPEPPHGHGQHHYYFWVYALNRAVTGTPTREDFLQEYADAILEQARFVATYSR